MLNLYPRDVVIFPHPQSQPLKQVLDLTNAPLAVRLENLNGRRCIFPDSKELKFEVTAAIDAKIVLRTYSGKVDVCLDGEPVNAEIISVDLPFGLKSLYRESNVITLSPGVHTLSLISDVEDLPYLPSVLLSGSFALGSDRLIRPLPTVQMTAAEFFANHLIEYVGAVVFNGCFDLREYEGIAFEHQGMAVELLLDGQSQESRLWAPFNWKVPETYRRDGVKVELRIATSIGPLFGDYPEHQAVEMKNRLDPWWSGVRCL